MVDASLLMGACLTVGQFCLINFAGGMSSDGCDSTDGALCNCEPFFENELCWGHVSSDYCESTDEALSNCGPFF